MPETIYTIPVNEAFDACAQDPKKGCPICRLYNKLEENELDLILGASMMEPDVRAKTNEQGFCRTHYDRMMARKNRLGIALILESHLDKLRADMDGSAVTRLLKGKDAPATRRLDVLQNQCYLCNRIQDALDKITDNAVYLWETDRAFREKVKKQPYYCLPHYAALIAQGKAQLSKKDFPTFFADLRDTNNTYFDSLREDIRLFIRKFDYRYDETPWGNAKDSVERAVRFLSADLHQEVKKDDK